MAKKAEAPAHRDIGIDVAAPPRTCDDAKCPFHGELRVRGAMIVGRVISSKMQRTVVVSKERELFVQKYERLEKRTSKYRAHLPPCMDAKDGDEVKIMECRPLAKSVAYVVIENMGGGKK